MSRVEKKRKKLNRRRLLYICIFAYIIFIISCLFAVNFAFNTLSTGEVKQTLFKMSYKRNIIYFTVFGEEKYVSLKGVFDIFKSLYN
ncbi:hypothetical protein [Thermoanaerobacterium sp. RBIITD]|uniref:hypothetical protein n=1 Tax=Thermoanaerobacterium sp. RBIITD TaxID=1550240 RepID=UPI000BB89FE9|nr:hypothetical protein [Thermoanaerobacterium sp. RBIITD]SNX55232.1 hypothetical protein SAMN05660242_3044 [Thermoanaerobacterium sp. RBIITD]